MQNNFYVYALFRPWDGSPCYVGKGKGNRWRVHGYKNRCTNQRLASIVAKAGGPLPKEKLAENLSETEAFDLERILIGLIGRGNKGPLVNFTDGGEGASGLEISEERRLSISKRHRGKTLSPEHIAAFTASRTPSEETRKKIADSKIGKNRSPETVAKMSAATTLHMADPKRKASVAAANAKRVWTPEMRAAHGFRMAEVAAQKRVEACQ